jgi:hypothetical protein
MSDFFQHGLISTLHRLVDGPLIDRQEPLPPLESVVLVLPCHQALRYSVGSIPDSSARTHASARFHR